MARQTTEVDPASRGDWVEFLFTLSLSVSIRAFEYLQRLITISRILTEAENLQDILYIVMRYLDPRIIS